MPLSAPSKDKHVPNGTQLHTHLCGAYANAACHQLVPRPRWLMMRVLLHLVLHLSIAQSSSPIFQALLQVSTCSFGLVCCTAILFLRCTAHPFMFVLSLPVTNVST